MSKYLLDSNVLIEPHQNYYPFDFALSFWRQLGNILRRRDAIILKVVNDEIARADDRLSNWLRDINKDVKPMSVSRNQKVHDNYALVIQYIQECGFYKENAIQNWARENIADPWLIATAMSGDYKIVTREQPTGNLSRKNLQGNPKIPDVAKIFDAQCISLFDFMLQTGFRL